MMDAFDSSDDELPFSSGPLFGRMDLSLGRPGLRRGNGGANCFFLPATDAADILNEIISTLTGNTCDDSVEVDIDDSLVIDKNCTLNPSSLLDLSAKVVAKHCSCSVLEHHSPPLDESLLRKVAFWAFPQDVYRIRAYAYLTDNLSCWRRAMNLIREDKVKEMWQVGFMATASLVKYCQQSEARTCSEISVSLVFEKQKIISSSCSDCRSEVWCEHIIAACLYRIRNPKKVRVHAPMTEILSTLDRTQLQKLVQYAVEDDPAGVLGKVFRHVDNVRDKTSEMSMMSGAPDPTFGGLHGDKSQWQLSLELLDKRLRNDLDSMIRMRSLFDFADRRQEYYPDSFDIALKTKAKFFTYVTPILELARQGEYMAAAEVMKHVAMAVVAKMSTTSRSDCPTLSRLWHDISRIYSLLVLKTDDQAARNLLTSTAEALNRTPNVNDHLLGMSLWAELPSLCTLYPLEANKIRESGQVLVEPLLAGTLSACPKELKDLLEGSDTMNKSSYDEDLVTMIARLETVVYFEVEKSSQKIARLAFMVLHKLAILTQEDSVIGAYLPTSSSSDDCWNSPLLQALQSSCSLPVTTGPSFSSLLGKSKSARMGAKGSSKGKNPAKRLKKTPASELITQAVLTKGQVAHAMMYTLRLLTSSSTQKGTNMDAGGRKLLTGFCLQALEISRHRTTAATNSITQLEQDWLLKLETYVCDYLQTSGAQDASDAVMMYVDAISAIGTNFYTARSGAYPLVLLEMLCHVCTNNESLKTSKGRQVVKICSEILLNSAACLDAVTLPELRSFDLLIEAITDGTNMSSQRKHREFAIRKFHVITETFLSLVGTDANQDVDLLVQILNHFESIKSVPLLKMISKDLRMHVWRFKEDNRVIEAMLRFSIHAYREAQLLLGNSFNSSDKQAESVEREFIFNLTRRLGILSLAIFSQGWQSIFSCKELQELIMIIEPKVNENPDLPLPANVINVIMEFCEAKCFHEEDACVLLTKFFKPGDTNFCIAIDKIIDNAENFHAGALFHLAQLQQTQKRGRKDVMDADVFAIVEKAVEKISQVTPKIVEYIDWMFTSCIGSNRREPLKSAFLSKMVTVVCSHAQSHPEIILRLLQNMEQHQQGLVRHSTTSELGTALVIAYREHFANRFRDCGHAAYATVIAEMQRARLECKHYVKNGEADFDAVVVEYIRRTHHTKKKLMKLLLQEFQLAAKST